MSNQPLSSWIHGLFRECSVMFLALVLASLPFAAAEAQLAVSQNAPVAAQMATA